MCATVGGSGLEQMNDDDAVKKAFDNYHKFTNHV